MILLEAVKAVILLRENLEKRKEDFYKKIFTALMEMLNSSRKIVNLSAIKILIEICNFDYKIVIKEKIKFIELLKNTNKNIAFLAIILLIKISDLKEISENLSIFISKSYEICFDFVIENLQKIVKFLLGKYAENCVEILIKFNIKLWEIYNNNENLQKQIMENFIEILPKITEKHCDFIIEWLLNLDTNFQNIKILVFFLMFH